MVKFPAPDKGGAPVRRLRQDSVRADVEVFLRTNPAGRIPINRFDGKQLIPATARVTLNATQRKTTMTIKKGLTFQSGPSKLGGTCGGRTHDKRIKSPLLYQLS